MAEKLEGELAKIRKTAMNQGIEIGRKKFIKGLLKKYPPEELSEILDMEKSTLINLMYE